MHVSKDSDFGIMIVACEYFVICYEVFGINYASKYIFLQTIIMKHSQKLWLLSHLSEFFDVLAGY